MFSIAQILHQSEGQSTSVHMMDKFSVIIMSLIYSFPEVYMLLKIVFGVKNKSTEVAAFPWLT